MADKITVEDLIKKYIMGGDDAVKTAMTTNNVASNQDLTLNDLKMDSLDVVQLAVKIQDDLGINLSDDEFAKVPNGQGGFKPADKVTLGDITEIINSKKA